MIKKEKAYCQECDEIIKVMQKMHCKICSRCRVVLPESAFALKWFLPTPTNFSSLEVICKVDEEVFDSSYEDFSRDVIDFAKEHGFAFLRKSNKLLKGSWVKVGDKRYKLK